MKIGVYYIESNIAGPEVGQYNREFLADLSKRTNIEMEFSDVDNLDKYDMVLDFVGGGGRV